MTAFDTILRGGEVFDGTGAPAQRRGVGIREGRVVAIDSNLQPSPGTRVIDARGKWVMPGFLDMHTHYDAEVLAAPSLSESVRHGVTTIALGSCSLSTVHSTPLDCADLFSRVEAVPRAHVLSVLEREKTWTDAAGYVRGLESRPIVPNLALFLGHSDLRAHVMGLKRSVERGVRPTPAEMARMETLVQDALDAGFMGLSTMTTRIDKIDGDRARSKPLPSTFAGFREYRRLNAILRRAGRVLQSAPNIENPFNVTMFMEESAGLFGRKPLKTTLLTAVDSKSNRLLGHIAGPIARIVNRFGHGNMRFQHLPTAFQLYADGIDFVVFEELGAGAAALHLADEVERNALLKDETYRRRFRRDYDEPFAPRLWHRDLHDAEIVACPDASVVGKSFGRVAEERGIHPVDAFLDLVVAHGRGVRWRTTLGNDRKKHLDRISADRGVMIGFADSGAHLRNMAFYNFGVRLLRRAKEAQRGAHPFMSIERAVHRLTGELADWFGLDAGRLRVGDRADIAIIDPAGLDARVDDYHESPIPEFGGLSRMVNRNDAAVSATLVAGNVVFENGVAQRGVRTGRVLRAGEARGTIDPATLPPLATTTTATA